MDEYSKSKNKNDLTREAIIGLGEASFRKNYYPELQARLLDLERINVRNRALITAIPDILLVVDSESQIVPFSADANKDAMVNAIINNKGIIDNMYQIIAQVKKERQLISYNFCLTYNKEVNYFESRIHISELDEVLIIIRNITESVMMEIKLRQMVETDSLSNLKNRYSFEKKLKEYDEKEINNLAILSIDIDGLKIVNDTLGHIAGDAIIIEVARVLKEEFGDSAFLSRIGGDEFSAIVENTSIKSIEQHMIQIKNRLIGRCTIEGVLDISLSIGYSFHEKGKVKMICLYQEADSNMYQNKLLKESSIRGNIVKALMKTLEAKDYITEGHAERMETLATQIGKLLALPQSQIDRIQLLCKFHDIGKVGIPDSILKKQGPLTEDEMKVMRTHCSIGERIAVESVELREIAPLILRHHEKWDGKGYPLNLKGKDIPIECRVLAIVDAFDAMTNDRPYRKALPLSLAIKEINICSGSHFDPELVHLFNRIYEIAYL